MKQLFFTMTDENGVEYVNTSDTIYYIPVKSSKKSIFDKLERLKQRIEKSSLYSRRS